MRVRYAAYGSNLHPERLRRRVPSARLLGAANVDGFALRFNKSGQDGSGKCNIVAANASVHVAVYEMLTDERSKLDRIEGLNVGYAAAQLDVPGFGGCFSYLACDTHVDDVLAPFSWYKELVLVGCELHKFPGEYVDAIRAVPHVADDDRQRHAEHMRIIEHARKVHGK